MEEKIKIIIGQEQVGWVYTDLYLSGRTRHQNPFCYVRWPDIVLRQKQGIIFPSGFCIQTKHHNSQTAFLDPWPFIKRRSTCFPVNPSLVVDFHAQAPLRLLSWILIPEQAQEEPGTPESSSHRTGSLYRCRLFFRGLFIPILFQIPEVIRVMKGHFKQWTAWWRWRSVVKSGGCPWYPWQRRTGQLVKFSEACQMERERKLPLQMEAPLPPPAPANPQHPNEISTF